MRDEQRHLSNETLFLAADCELSPLHETEAFAHLAKCPVCSARMEKLQSVVSDFSRAHRENLSAELPSAADSRAALQTQLAELSSASKRPAWRHQIANLFVGSRWAYVAAVFLVAALGLRLFLEICAYAIRERR